MNALATRKRLLLAETELHRRLIGVECLHLRGQWDGAVAFSRRHRWWILGGALVAGVALARHRTALTCWLPAVLATWRAVQR